MTETERMQGEINSAQPEWKGMAKEDISILVVDDDDSLLGVLSQLLQEDGYQVTTASSGEEALDRYRENHFPLVISDVKMPGMSGIALLQKIKEINSDGEVIIMTSYATLDIAVSALRLGAYDFLIKPFEDIELVIALVNRAADKIRLTRENRALLHDLKKKLNDLEQINAFLQNLAVRDGLTGLYNHQYFHEAIAKELARCQRSKGIFSLLFLDIDHFKNYNDTFGHPAGDLVLKKVAQLLSARFRESDVIARYGGEEFVVLLPGAPKQKALICAEDIRSMISAYPFEGRESQPLGFVSVSVGVATYPENGNVSEALLRSADSALYQAKTAGRNKICGTGQAAC
jgi:two-component system, cell cycle response regulator